jgi:hypothetical protein
MVIVLVGKTAQSMWDKPFDVVHQRWRQWTVPVYAHQALNCLLRTIPRLIDLILYLKGC